ncbi:MAG: hypothetical protein ABTA16_00355 [Niallia sp.]
MRAANVSMIINKPTLINFTNEDIISEVKNYEEKRIVVVTKYLNDLESSDGTTTIIEGEYYDLLMSQSSEFTEGKPLNDYREHDLWYVIDLKRNEQQTPLNE